MFTYPNQKNNNVLALRFLHHTLLTTRVQLGVTPKLGFFYGVKEQ